MTGQTLAHYQITGKLGEGGMGVVYKARDSCLNRDVAVKVLPAGMVANAERRRRFVQEAQAASALNHPNIITIHDIGSENGTDFMVMEYVPGKSLDQVIPRQGLPLGEALQYAVQIADAMAAAHGAGILHRDLKPGTDWRASVWRVPATGGEEVKLIDSVPTVVDFAVTEDGIYFLDGEARGSGSVPLRFLDFATNEVTTVSAALGEARWGLTVSPDRRTILYAQFDRYESDLVMLELPE